MNFLDSLAIESSLSTTENGANTYTTTGDPVLNLFALGGSYRNRTEEDCINLFKQAFLAEPRLAIKALMYLRDVTDGAGERRFFRVVYKWLSQNYPEWALAILYLIPVYGRWDDVFAALNTGTSVEGTVWIMIMNQLREDMKSDTPSLLAKWLPSENTSSLKTRSLATRTRKMLGLTSKEYRKMLSELRGKIKVLERTMSANQWDQIDFSKIPSVAGFRYAHCFRARPETATRYALFMADKHTHVNAKALNPQAIVHSVFLGVGDAEIDKYWNDLPDYYLGKEEPGIAVVDVSGSMTGTPMEAAIGLGAYVAKKAKGPFKDHFITFSTRPSLVKMQGDSIKEALLDMKQADWGFSTNIEAVFELLLQTAIKNHTPQNEMPKTLYIFSDMEFDDACCISSCDRDTLLESIKKRWNAYDYDMPRLILWNLDARNDTIPIVGGSYSYISGFSPSMISAVLSGKNGRELMLEKLNSERYEPVERVFKDHGELVNSADVGKGRV